MSITIIAAIANNSVIGDKNTLLWKLSKDMKHFKNTTTGHTVIMGKKTFLSIGKVLPNRKNIIVTRDKNLNIPEGVTLCHNPKELFLKNQNEAEEIFVIGGGEIYREAMIYAHKLIITHVETTIAGDTTFPEIDPISWEKVSETSEMKDESNDHNMLFTVYTRKKTI